MVTTSSNKNLLLLQRGNTSQSPNPSIRRTQKRNTIVRNSHYRSKEYAQAYQRYFQSQKNSQDRGEKHLAYHNMGNSFMQQKQYEKAA